MSFRIVATDTGVTAPFFATLDADDKVTWTDQDFHASRFDTKVDAEEFARAWIGAVGWKVQPICEPA